MKTSIFALTISSAAAFSPVAKNTQSTTQLNLGYISGPEGGLKHKPFGSPGHFETIGDKSDAGRTADYNAASLAHKPFGAPGHFETFGDKSAAGREVTNGEEIHHGRSSYAPVKNYQHVCGEIGYEETELSSAMVSPTYSAPAQSYAPGSWSPN